MSTHANDIVDARAVRFVRLVAQLLVECVRRQIAQYILVVVPPAGYSVAITKWIVQPSGHQSRYSPYSSIPALYILLVGLHVLVLINRFSVPYHNDANIKQIRERYNFQLK